MEEMLAQLKLLRTPDPLAQALVQLADSFELTRNLLLDANPQWERSESWDDLDEAMVAWIRWQETL